MLPKSPPYILDIDESKVKGHISNINADKKLHFELLLESYLGNPFAPVVLLNINPGYSSDDLTYHRQQTFINLSRANLEHQPHVFRFYLLNPCIPAPGRDWWEKKRGPLIRDTSKDVVANNVLCVEYFPYHSQKLGHFELRLPSQEYSFQLVRQSLERNSVIILMRSRKLWLSIIPELEYYLFLYSVRSIQNSTICPNNCPNGYAAIINKLKVL